MRTTDIKKLADAGETFAYSPHKHGYLYEVRVISTTAKRGVYSGFCKTGEATAIRIEYVSCSGLDDRSVPPAHIRSTWNAHLELKAARKAL
jgi:hypothetical protein